jgi:hypothetical protein
MNVDPKLTKMLVAALATATFVWTGCDSHDEHAAPAGGHTSPYPACNEITQSCHEVDIGEGPIHDCHDKAHAAKSDGDCTPIKDNCLRICAEAKADAGGGRDGGP